MLAYESSDYDDIPDYDHLPAYEEEPGYEFNAADLDSPVEDLCRFAVIFISKNKLRVYESKLLKLLSANICHSNRRHIVRALGNIGTRAFVETLLRMLFEEDGLILGDIACSLGKLRATEATPRLEELVDSEIDWVASKCRYALRQLHRHG